MSRKKEQKPSFYHNVKRCSHYFHVRGIGIFKHVVDAENTCQIWRKFVNNFWIFSHREKNDNLPLFHDTVQVFHVQKSLLVGYIGNMTALTKSSTKPRQPSTRSRTQSVWADRRPCRLGFRLAVCTHHSFTRHALSREATMLWQQNHSISVLTAIFPVVTTTFVVLSSNKIHSGCYNDGGDGDN